MDPERHRRVSDLYVRACDLAADARGPFLDRECAGDPELRAEVESLLAQEGEASRVFAGIRAGDGGTPTEPLHSGDTTTQSRRDAQFPRDFGRFRLLRCIGRGGMGEVYEAEDRQLVRRVALKMILGGEGHPGAEKRFLQEARIAGTLDHPNVVPVYDFGIVDETAYYTMPLVEGTTLEQLIPFLHGRTDDPPPAFLQMPVDWSGRVGLILDWFVGALDGLEHAHAKGVVHRDVKPSNLMVDAHDGRLRLTDFGLARASHLSGLTRDGARLGTVAYMSPEQVREDGTDARTDVYSMGVALYRTLLDDLPYEADTTAAYMNRILFAPPAAPGGRKPALPRDVVTILLKCLEKTPGDRYPTASAVAADIRRFRRHEPISARPVRMMGRLARWTRRRPVVVALATALAVTGLVLLALAGQTIRNTAILRGQEAERSIRLGNYALARKDYEGALARFGHAIELVPRNLDGHLGRAAVAVVQLAEGDAAVDLRAALEDLAAAAAIEPDLVSVHLLRARLLQGLNDPDGAAREREAARRIEPRVALDFRLIGDSKRAEGDCRGAIADYDRALAADPQLSMAALGRGVCYREIGDRQRAERDAAIASHLVPDDAFPHNNLANALADQGKFDEAFREHERALEIEPETALFHFNYGTNLKESGPGRYGAAEAQLRRALELDPRLTKAHNNLGDVLAETDRLVEAAAEYRSALTIEEEKAEKKDEEDYLVAQTGICDVALRMRDLVLARESCVKARDLEPEDPAGHYNLAVLRMLEGDHDAALVSLGDDVQFGDHDFGYLLDDVAFEPLRKDPRFHALVERMRTAAAVADGKP